jgi:ribose-phosphate pyrophosphokinase
MKLITPYAINALTPNVIIKHFPDTESCVQILLLKSLKNKKVTIHHGLFPEQDKRIFELLLILSLVKKYTKDIELYTPYLPYAKQDKENKKGEAVSASVLCELLKSQGVKKLITYDCHFLPGAGNFKRAGLNIENKTSAKMLYKEAKKYFGVDKFLVISPDEGASYFTEVAEGHTLNKKRGVSVETGKNQTEIYAHIDQIEGDIDVKGKNLCILDDVISTGSTIMKTIEHLKKLGAKEIIVGATHGVFAGVDIPKKIIKSGAKMIFVTDSIQNKQNKKIKVIKLPNF